MRRSTALLAAAYMSIASYGERSEEVETRRMFRDWMAVHNKTYSSGRTEAFPPRKRKNAKFCEGILLI